MRSYGSVLGFKDSSLTASAMGYTDVHNVCRHLAVDMCRTSGYLAMSCYCDEEHQKERLTHGLGCPGMNVTIHFWQSFMDHLLVQVVVGVSACTWQACCLQVVFKYFLLPYPQVVMCGFFVFHKGVCFRSRN